MIEPTVRSANAFLSEIFDRGLHSGIQGLSRRDRELFLIWDFVIETEMGGLSGYLYNRLAKRGRLAATARAMEKYDVGLLAPITRELARRFLGWGARGSDTWEVSRRRSISDARLELLQQRCDEASRSGYGLEESKVAAIASRPPRWTPRRNPARRRR